MSARPGRSMLLASLALLCLASACSGDSDSDKKTPVALSVIAESSIPAATPAPGPRLAYVKGDGNRRELVVYDLAAGKPAWARKLGEMTRVARLGDHFVLSDDKIASVLNADGSKLEQVFYARANEHILNAAGSPDGLTIAITLRAEPDPTPSQGTPVAVPYLGSILLLEASSKRTLRRVEVNQTDMPSYRAIPTWPVWRDDSQGVLVYGASGSDRPGSILTVFLDGRVVVHDVTGYIDVAPNGRFVAHDVFSLGCLSVSGHRVAIRDLDAGKDVAVLEDATKAFTGWQWSPDSSQYLIRSLPWESTAAEGPDCSYWQQPPDWLLLDVRSGQVRPVNDYNAVLQSWYGNRLVALADCDGWDGPARASHWQTYQVACISLGLPSSGSISVGGKTIDRSDRFSILGFIN